VVISEPMKIELLSHDEHERLRGEEPALKQSKIRYSYERWFKARTALVQRLKSYGKSDKTGYGGGDFYIGEGWFGHGGFHIVLLNWTSLNVGFVSSCEHFLHDGYSDFLVTIGKSLSVKDDHDFEIIITVFRSYMSFLDMKAAEGYNVLNTDRHFRWLRPLIG
jgi:hypothetical protein